MTESERVTETARGLCVACDSAFPSEPSVDSCCEPCPDASVGGGGGEERGVEEGDEVER